MTIEVGSFVIINEVDAPVCRLVAQVTDIQSFTGYGKTFKKVIAKYIAEYPNQLYCTADIERVTLVSDFGVEVTLTENHVICEKQRESIAKYVDGRIRKWQENTVVVHEPIRKTLTDLVDEGEFADRSSTCSEEITFEQFSTLCVPENGTTVFVTGINKYFKYNIVTKSWEEAVK